MRWFGPKEIKLHVGQFIQEHAAELKGKRVLDMPCGNGHSLQLLKNVGAETYGADLFPELNRVSDVPVSSFNMGERLPFTDQSFDFVLCQEGIEHVGSQDRVFAEISRVLKPSGILLMTTPNYSNLKSRFSYLLTESEAFGRLAPPNEVESIWLSGKEETRVYFGHVFLTGILRLRLFGITSGFKIEQIYSSRVNYTSLFLFPFVYPFILFFSFKTMARFRRKSKNHSSALEIRRLMTSPQVLLENHLIVKFRKITTIQKALASLSHTRETADLTT